ncbi:MAG: PhoH family protein [Candidatus Marinimicrobia bacterium]|jgi:phosphate starvation-inducible PhoH-like protein|nr:PhoH family protein [Candidatus Neomarinimicrobiota bacterium]MDP6569582.1 PhoH family protein [Candidatus Neomarinimicrobiota bacterium]MDP7025718.1 PhoH family protein [Candidatus Neomarinimicrobiota bacterium]|tara:strand:- start:886 stop:1839 length:954 start_codon:yes stop_codon:yes gene_type:complete
MKKEIQIQGIDAVEITGIADTNLKILEDSFTCKILLRGDTIFMDGDEQPVTQAEEVISEMMNTFSRKNSLTEGDVRSLVALISEGHHVKANDSEQVLLYTKQGKIVPKSEGQRTMVETCQNSDISLVIGPAGTGKTYLAVAQAVAAFKNRHVKRIILSRPAVEAGENLGFLPGDLREKIDPYLTPLYDALHDMFASATLKSHVSKRVIEVVPLAYMRGRTLNDAFIILDEAQNCTAMQMKMFLTRMGPNSKAIITGDVTQMDLPSRDNSGLLQAETLLKGIDGIGFVYMTEEDVVRHRLVKDIIKAYNKNGGNKGGK